MIEKLQAQHWILVSLVLSGFTASGMITLTNPDLSTYLGTVELVLSLVAGLAVMLTVQLYGKAWLTIRQGGVGESSE